MFGKLTGTCALVVLGGACAHAQYNHKSAVQGDTKTAAKYEPNSSMASYVLGRSLAEKGNLQAGIVQLEHAEQADPSNLDTHVSLASAYSRAGRVDDARRERLRSLELWSNEDAASRQ